MRLRATPLIGLPLLLLLVVLAVLVGGGGAAWADGDFPTLREDAQRRSLVQRDEGIALELATDFAYYSADAELDAASQADLKASGQGVGILGVGLHAHLLRAMGVTFGAYHAASNSLGVKRVRSGSTYMLAPDALETTGFMFGVEANPIGFGNVQTSVGAEVLTGIGFAYYAGLRIELKDWRISPRVTYADLSYDPDEWNATSYAWGFGFGVQVSYSLASGRP